MLANSTWAEIEQADGQAQDVLAMSMEAGISPADGQAQNLLAPFVELAAAAERSLLLPAAIGWSPVVLATAER